MKLSTPSYSRIFLTSLAIFRLGVEGQVCKFQDDLPINVEDFDQPDWAVIIETAFPTWDVPAGGCPRLDMIGGVLKEGFDAFPTPVAGKFNPCYYTKALDGLDPIFGGYPTPIDTKYPYEFASPFFKQPGDGSAHHCPMNASPDTRVHYCPKTGIGGCGEGVKYCNKITNEFGIGHVPPTVPLAAIKNAFLSCQEDVCDWFDDGVNQCNIPKTVLDRLVVDTFEVDGTIKFTPSKILDDLPATDPKSTYFSLDYPKSTYYKQDDLSPHYCSEAVAAEDIWEDFCPYVHTGENSGLYRHAHIALAALEVWMANKCKPTKCPSTWLDSPNAKGYGEDMMTSTSTTFAEMDDNSDPMAQPIVPYHWPNAGDGIYPGHNLYGDFMIKPAPGIYINQFVCARSTSSAAGASMVVAGGVSLAVATISIIAYYFRARKLEYDDVEKNLI